MHFRNHGSTVFQISQYFIDVSSPFFFAFGSLTKKSVKVVLTHSDNLVRLNHNDLFLCYCPVPYMKCVYVHKIFYCIFRTFTFIMDL